MGPVIETIDAGHYERTGDKKKAPYCNACQTPWPCPDIIAARQKQAQYADSLRINALVSSDTRKTYI